MKINTKEKYDRIHNPLIPKSRQQKKERILIVETVRSPLKKLIPFIPEKDKKPSSLKPVHFKRGLTLSDLLSACYGGALRSSGHYYYSNSSIQGMIKNAAHKRAIAKHKRQKAYHQMCRR